MLERYGVEHSSQSQIVEEKRRATCIERCGVENPFKASDVRDKSRATMLERYGVENASQSPEFRARMVATCVQRYGVEHSSQSSDVRARYVATCLERYGVENPSSTHDVRERIRTTCRERYGVDSPFMSEAVQEKKRQTMLARYGVEHASHIPSRDWKKSALRRHETMKVNGTYARQSSKAEDAFVAALIEVVAPLAVERHVEVNGWCVDVLIPELALYIDYDGRYYHGLDRPLDVIAEFKDPTDVTIYGTYLRDREKDAWFEANDVSHVRVVEGDEDEFMVWLAGVLTGEV